MDDLLKIECEWWGASAGETDIAQACRGAIGISVGDQYLTRLEDSWAETVRSRMNGDAYTLARWFAGNWWRLRWEPETAGSQSDIDWRMSHSMASAGGGYSWPGILFASDGESIAIAARPSSERVMGPVRYLSGLNTRISAGDFEQGIDSFLSLVTSRLHAKGHADSELVELWEDVMAERGDPELSVLRRMEAICGYDPDEAPEELMRLLLEDDFNFGVQAVMEVAAHARHSTHQVLHEISGLTNKPQAGGYQCRPETLKATPERQIGNRPWERAVSLARRARKEWNLDDEPVSNMKLAELFKTTERAFSRPKAELSVPLALGLRSRDENSLDVYIGRTTSTSRRFAASRLLGQWLEMNGETEPLIPVSDAKTAQQQFQRAFAQEFLCPYKALMNRLQFAPRTEEDIEEAADYFGVSPLLVKTTLVNNGELDRNSLGWFA